MIEQVQKERSAKVDYKISANDLSDGLKKAYEKIRRLNRALYKACANWARAELMWASLLDFKCPEDWDEMERKCLAKAEQYK